MSTNKLMPSIAISSAFVCLAITGSHGLNAKETKITSYGSFGYVPESGPLKIAKLLSNTDETLKRVKVIGCLVPMTGQKSGTHLFLIDQIGKSIPKPAVEHSIELVSANPGESTKRQVLVDVLKDARPKKRCVCVEGVLQRSESVGSISKFRYFEIKRMSESEFKIIDDRFDGGVGDFDDFRHRKPAELAR